jgi:hypothetical protein
MKSIPETRPFAGPSLLWLAIVHVLLFVATGVAGTLLGHGMPVANPYGSGTAAREYFANNPLALRVSAFFFLGSSVPLGIYAATVVARLRYLRVRAAGTNIAFYGGASAAFALLISGLLSWTLSVPEVAASLPTTRFIHFLTFLFGGTGFAVCFGLLAAGVSVTSYFTRLLPRWLVWFGLVIAMAGELSPLSMISYYATLFIPVVRFGGFIWLIAVGAKLPKRRESAVEAVMAA